MSKDPIHTDNAPSAIGTYSQAIRSGNQVYISGQIPLDPDSMEIVEGDFASRAHRVFQNIKAVSEEADAKLAHIVKITIYLTDLDNFATVNNVMEQYFNKPYPARAAIGVASLPKGSDIEADAILVVPTSAPRDLAKET